MKTRGKIEQLWRQEKYHVMMHSHQHYNHIRAMLKSTPPYAEV
ncbi:MAG: type II DNA modification enzyme, partial [Staphylococcus lugdunensis]|nr:type II DNA modification enzyme [Staphylococcus lugdunensis]